jgi:hypothetical protein
VENFFVVQCVKPCNRKAIDKARKNTGAVPFSTAKLQGGMIALRGARAQPGTQ